MKKDISKIPKGFYCYTVRNGDFIICPYWRIIKDRPKQANGWCDFLEKGDIELMLESETYRLNEDGSKKLIYKKGELPPIPMSLLWDQCKECGINLRDEGEK